MRSPAVLQGSQVPQGCLCWAEQAEHWVAPGAGAAPEACLLQTQQQAWVQGEMKLPYRPCTAIHGLMRK